MDIIVVLSKATLKLYTISLFLSRDFL